MLALVIPRDLRLHAAGFVARAGAYAELARLARGPEIGPAHPQPALARLFEMRIVPGGAVVDAHFHPRDAARTAPGKAAYLVLAALERRILVERIDDDAAHAHGRDHFLVRIVGRLSVHEIVMLVIALRLMVQHFDMLEPLHPPVSRPPGNDRAHRRAVDVQQVLA